MRLAYLTNLVTRLIRSVKINNKHDEQLCKGEIHWALRADWSDFIVISLSWVLFRRDSCCKMVCPKNIRLTCLFLKYGRPYDKSIWSLFFVRQSSKTFGCCIETGYIPALNIRVQISVPKCQESSHHYPFHPTLHLQFPPLFVWEKEKLRNRKEGRDLMLAQFPSNTVTLHCWSLHSVKVLNGL